MRNLEMRGLENFLDIAKFVIGPLRAVLPHNKELILRYDIVELGILSGHIRTVLRGDAKTSPFDVT